jgi:hypothetical protein
VLHNTVGGHRIATVNGNTAIQFATVMASSGTMTLQVQPGATLTVQSAPRPGRVLLMAGGQLKNNGTLTAHEVEAFQAGTISGSGVFSDDVRNTAGEVAPGDGVGTMTIMGDFHQSDLGKLTIEIGGTAAGQFDSILVGGNVTLDGELNISLVNGFQPTTTRDFTVVTAASLSDLGLTLTGSTSGFSLSVGGGNRLILSFVGSGITGDFNSDGQYNCLDVDALVADIVGPGTPTVYDLTGDGNVDHADLNAWLAEAGSVNLPSQNAYLEGDANLDGSVDGSDFGLWNANKFTATAAWCRGDFTADGNVDGSDFGRWNANKFTSANSVSAVPEPTRVCLAMLLLGIARLTRNRPGSSPGSRCQTNRGADATRSHCPGPARFHAEYDRSTRYPTRDCSHRLASWAFADG